MSDTDLFAECARLMGEFSKENDPELTDAYKSIEQANRESQTKEVSAAMRVPDDNVSGLEISKVLTISTGHITRRTAELMDAKEINLPVHYQWGEYGWIFWTGREDYEFDETPDDLLLCIMFAKDKGCRYLLLDRDGDRIDELPSYDW